MTHQVDSTINADNTFTVSGNDIPRQDPLQVGDVVEIETNQFTLIERLGNDVASLSAKFGRAIDFCSNNCSVC
jgi:hypothetical protein